MATPLHFHVWIARPANRKFAYNPDMMVKWLMRFESTAAALGAIAALEADIYWVGVSRRHPEGYDKYRDVDKWGFAILPCNNCQFVDYKLILDL